MRKVTDDIFLKLPLWTFLGATDQCVENISVQISDVQAEIRPKNLQRVSQKRFRLSNRPQ